MFPSAIVSLALAASALANVYLTAPVSSTSWPAGQQATITWQDDGQSPSLASFGVAKFSIYVGNANEQTPLQLISANVSVANVSSLTFTPDPTIGPNSDEYFIRVESLNLKDAKSPQYPALAFSAKFTLTGMSGQFNTSVQQEIDGQSTAPIGGTAAPTSGTSSPTAAPKTTASSSGTSKAASPTSTTKSNGADKHGVTSLAGLVGVAAALFGAALL
ncbi:hypothetical protein SCLCIDRAFT_1223621 [Scleroderma citrinum Foug A]|uniref:Yeast cell wall synthesis Kre9/Knh1-like N-terminal domain-containing protein n=1 Tax=Scleroderma citrinum Foug A TaxID=1036808 RepID=A0A0C2YS62_9AGAM|nr:hypothetical protein SCLCIDRAFT_1223621 [Scleroderma citrinum Foug A]